MTTDSSNAGPPSKGTQQFDLPIVEGTLTRLLSPTRGLGEEQKYLTEDERRAVGHVTIQKSHYSGRQPEIRVVHTHDEEASKFDGTTEYRFVVTDESRRLCRYAKNNPEDVPYEVRLALLEYGYYDASTEPKNLPWFESYVRTATTMCYHHAEGDRSVLSKVYFEDIQHRLMNIARAASLISRFDSPQDLPKQALGDDESLDELGEEPIQNQTSWDDVDVTLLAYRSLFAEWDFPASFSALPPQEETSEQLLSLPKSTNDTQAWENYLEVISDYLNFEDTDSGSENSSLRSTPLESAGYSVFEVTPEDSDDRLDHVLIRMAGSDHIVQHEFRVTDWERQECVYEARTTPTPPIEAITTLISTGWTPTNVPLFYVDNTAIETVEETYKLLRRLSSHLPSVEPGHTLFEDVREPLMELLILLVIEDELTSPEITNKVTTQVAKHAGVSDQETWLKEYPDPSELVSAVTKVLPPELFDRMVRRLDSLPSVRRTCADFDEPSIGDYLEN